MMDIIAKCSDSWSCSCICTFGHRPKTRALLVQRAKYLKRSGGVQRSPPPPLGASPHLHVAQGRRRAERTFRREPSLHPFFHEECEEFLAPRRGLIVARAGGGELVLYLFPEGRPARASSTPATRPPAPYYSVAYAALPGDSYEQRLPGTQMAGRRMAHGQGELARRKSQISTCRVAGSVERCGTSREELRTRLQEKGYLLYSNK